MLTIKEYDLKIWGEKDDNEEISESSTDELEKDFEPEYEDEKNELNEEKQEDFIPNYEDNNENNNNGMNIDFEIEYEDERDYKNNANTEAEACLQNEENNDSMFNNGIYTKDVFDHDNEKQVKFNENLQDKSNATMKGIIENPTTLKRKYEEYNHQQFEYEDNSAKIMKVDTISKRRELIDFLDVLYEEEGDLEKEQNMVKKTIEKEQFKKKQEKIEKITNSKQEINKSSTKIGKLEGYNSINSNIAEKLKEVIPNMFFLNKRIRRNKKKTKKRQNLIPNL